LATLKRVATPSLRTVELKGIFQPSITLKYANICGKFWWNFICISLIFNKKVLPALTIFNVFSTMHLSEFQHYFRPDLKPIFNGQILKIEESFLFFLNFLPNSFHLKSKSFKYSIIITFWKDFFYSAYVKMWDIFHISHKLFWFKGQFFFKKSSIIFKLFEFLCQTKLVQQFTAKKNIFWKKNIFCTIFW
jgi:hypothetical protein